MNALEPRVGPLSSSGYLSRRIFGSVIESLLVLPLSHNMSEYQAANTTREVQMASTP